MDNNSAIPDVKLYLRRSSGIDGFEEVRKGTIFTSPTILCCGGGLCEHKQVDLANGFAKRAEAIINTLRADDKYYKPYKVASVTYNPALTKISAIIDFNKLGNDQLFADFVQEQLLPLVIDKTGTKFSLSAIKKHFRNIQILAHSYGGVFIQQVGNVLVDKLKKLQFNEAEIDEITKQVVVITLGTAANLGTGKAKFTTVNIMHSRDHDAHFLTSNSFVEGILLEEAKKFNQPLAAIKFHRDPKTRHYNVDPRSNEILLRAQDKVSEDKLIRYDDALAVAKTEQNGFENGIPLHASIALSDIRRAYKSGNHAHEITDIPSEPENGHCSKGYTAYRYAEYLPDSLHRVESYLAYGYERHGLMLRLAAASALNNALNNSVRNFFNTRAHIDLPPVEKLLQSPLKEINPEVVYDPNNPRLNNSEYGYKEHYDFTKIARAIRYDERIKEACFKQDKHCGIKR